MSSPSNRSGKTLNSLFILGLGVGDVFWALDSNNPISAGIFVALTTSSLTQELLGKTVKIPESVSIKLDKLQSIGMMGRLLKEPKSRYLTFISLLAASNAVSNVPESITYQGLDIRESYQTLSNVFFSTACFRWAQKLAEGAPENPQKIAEKISDRRFLFGLGALFSALSGAQLASGLTKFASGLLPLISSKTVQKIPGICDYMYSGALLNAGLQTDETLKALAYSTFGVGFLSQAVQTSLKSDNSYIKEKFWQGLDGIEHASCAIFAVPNGGAVNQLRSYFTSRLGR